MKRQTKDGRRLQISGSSIEMNGGVKVGSEFIGGLQKRHILSKKPNVIKIPLPTENVTLDAKPFYYEVVLWPTTVRDGHIVDNSPRLKNSIELNYLCLFTILFVFYQ